MLGHPCVHNPLLFSYSLLHSCQFLVGVFELQKNKVQEELALDTKTLRDVVRRMPSIG